MARLYLDSAILIWNGNGIEGKDQIQNFWTELPSSEHSVITLDAQPITGNPNLLKIMIMFCLFNAILTFCFSSNCNKPFDFPSDSKWSSKISR